MMKKWTGLFISLLVLILLAYYVMGFLVERTLNKNINAFHNTTMASVHLDKYHRGWFSSRANLVFEMHIPAQQVTNENGSTKNNPPVDLNINFPLMINHGPFIFTDSGMRFGLGYVTTKPQTHYGALISYCNNTIFKYSLPSIITKGKTGPQDYQFEWLGLSAVLKISPNIDKIKGRWTAYGFNGDANNVSFKLGKVFNKFKFYYTEGLWIGQTHLSIPFFTLNADNAKVVEMEAFDVDLGSDISDKLLNYNANITLKKLFVNNNTYGPGSFKLSIKNLDPSAMADINKLQWTMLENNQHPELNMLALLADLPKLLSKGSELELSEMYLTVPDGQITGNLKLVLPQSDISDAAQIMQKAHGEGQFKAPAATVKALIAASLQSNSTNNQTQSTTARDPVPASSTTTDPVNDTANSEAQADTIIKNYINKGLLRVEGTYYIVDIKIDNQQLFINGKLFKPEMLN
ncbi:YdgA family protein [Legionella quateirensis]|nr:YdgA family protein [Legionella quateirensis]